METIVVKWDVSQEQGIESFTLQDLGLTSKYQWQNLSPRQQEQRLQKALNTMKDKVELVVDSWG